MSKIYQSIMTGINEAIEDSKAKDKILRRTYMSVEPVKFFSPEEIKRIRKITGFSQKAFANYMGVSEKTVEAWESGANKPSGVARRLLTMMETDEELTTKFPFVKVIKKRNS